MGIPQQKPSGLVSSSSSNTLQPTTATSRREKGKNCNDVLPIQKTVRAKRVSSQLHWLMVGMEQPCGHSDSGGFSCSARKAQAPIPVPLQNLNITPLTWHRQGSEAGHPLSLSERSRRQLCQLQGWAEHLRLILSCRGSECGLRYKGNERLWNIIDQLFVSKGKFD